MTPLLQASDAFAAIGRKLFETSELPVIALTAEGRILDVNPAARHLFQRPASLMRDSIGRLLCRSGGRWTGVGEPLQRALANGAAQMALDAPSTRWSVLSLDRLPSAHSAASDMAAVLATLRAPSGGDEHLLRSRYQLTPAEVRVARLLASGTAPARIAALLHVQLCTVRTHMQHLYDKTGTKRQVELVAKLLGQAAQDTSFAPA